MVIWTAKLSKKRLMFFVGLAVAAAVLLCLLVGVLHRSTEDGVGRLDTAEARVDYLLDLGWEVNPEPVSTLQLQLPDPLSDDYEEYNDLQKTQGFDLKGIQGCRVTRYTYAVENYPGRPDGVQVNLYLCEGLPVAGDVMVTGADGFQAGLEFPKEDS